ncbi:MAG: GIY-YIG nuclease family protein [Actinobacteria bacterium]|nr:GIY-YIG nuclease family protein [Actinomycetota bacterium]
MDRKKELKEKYRLMKPDMGVFMICLGSGNRCYIEAAKDLKSKMNRARFQLDFGSFPNKELQKDWKEQGGENFNLKILEKLEYDKDESRTDYSEDLEILKMIWDQKLLKEGMELYK